MITKKELVFKGPNLIDTEVKDVPWTCDGCLVPFEKYEDMRHHKHPCGCRATFCPTCYDHVAPKTSEGNITTGESNGKICSS
jgi:hypothetical protein